MIRKKPSLLSACTTFITFDDIPGQSSTSGIIPNNYSNLNWNNAEYINTSLSSTAGGYNLGARSRPFVLRNLPGTNVSLVTANGTRFSFDGLYLTSAWRANLCVNMKTIRNGTVPSVRLFNLTTTKPKRIICGDICRNIDTMTFESYGGFPNSTLPQNGSEFIVDNLCISFGR